MDTDAPTITADHLRDLDGTADGLVILDADELRVLPRAEAEEPLTKGATLVLTPAVATALLADVGGDREEAARRMTWELRRQLAGS